MSATAREYEDCDNWPGYVQGKTGYGMLGSRPAHRAVYERQFGLIPKGYDIHHLCGNRRCVALNHLQLLARREHSALHASKRTTCRNGHPFVDMYYQPPYGKNVSPLRVCRICRRTSKKKKRHGRI